VEGAAKTQQGRESVPQPEDKNIMMTKLEAIVQPSRFEAVKEVLTELGIGGMTISDVRGHGRQKGHTEVYRGREYTVDLLDRENRRWEDIFEQSGPGNPDSKSGTRRFGSLV
jgi:hypothetical protein